MNVNKRYVIVLLLFLLSGCTSMDSEELSSSSAGTQQIQETEDILDILMSIEEVFDLISDQYKETSIQSVSLQNGLGHYYYDVEFISEQFLYLVSINTEIKELEVLSQNTFSDQDVFLEGINILELIPIQELKETAEQAVGSSEITEWYLLKESDQVSWNGKVKKGIIKESEIKLNAQTGEIIEVEVI